MPMNFSKLLPFKDTVGSDPVQQPVAWLARTYNKRGRSIDIDVKYLCDLACYNCNRSIRRAPSKDRMTVAPIDFKRDKFADSKCGCGTPLKNGIGLTPYGYYSCACRYCGHIIGRTNSTDEQVVSATWNEAYEKYAQEKKQLSRY